jgi:hypothetical protein
LSRYFPVLIFVLNLVFLSFSQALYLAFFILSIISLFLIYKNRSALLEVFSLMKLSYFNLLKNIRKNPLNVLYQILVFSLLVPFTFSLSFLVPKNIVLAGSLMNVLAHYIGYIFGFIISLLFCE